jgi:hypothetical protein
MVSESDLSAGTRVSMPYPLVRGAWLALATIEEVYAVWSRSWRGCECRGGAPPQFRLPSQSFSSFPPAPHPTGQVGTLAMRYSSRILEMKNRRAGPC